jgi:hypothetical protein
VFATQQTPDFCCQRILKEAVAPGAGVSSERLLFMLRQEIILQKNKGETNYDHHLKAQCKPEKSRGIKRIPDKAGL